MKMYKLNRSSAVMAALLASIAGCSAESPNAGTLVNAPDKGGAESQTSDGSGGQVSSMGGAQSNDGQTATQSSACAVGQTQCNGQCVDLMSDPANCGSCANACSQVQGCVAGSCRCAAGLAPCGTACVDVANDVANCGGCGVSCVPGQLCQAGACQCQAGLLLCSGLCVDVMSDAANCGGCGVVCAPGQVCSVGQCSASCAAGLTQCGQSCVDLASNVGHCGACNVACPAGQVCTGGVCGCSPGQTLCNGQCVDLLSNMQNCGACGNICGAAQSCTSGVCACQAGLTACAGQCVDIATNAAHCGGCGVQCEAGQSCSGGVCSAGATGAGGTPATGGATSGSGGTGSDVASTGGVPASTGGVPASTGGAPASTGGDTANTGGDTASTGGDTASTGGDTQATGGDPDEDGTGGTPATGEGPACSTPEEETFSFFLISHEAVQRESGSADGFGGDLGGLAGADAICQRVAESVVPCAANRAWRAFLSTTSEDAIDRIGSGPWYDRVGRLLANNTSELVTDDPNDVRMLTNADPEIRDDLPNEFGVPNHNPDGTGDVDNHQILTGTGKNGRLYTQSDTGGATGSGGFQAGGSTACGEDGQWSAEKATCWGWTSSEPQGCPRAGHSWPRDISGVNWISVWNERGCAPGGVLEDVMDTSPTVGSWGGYGGWYCFAVTP